MEKYKTMADFGGVGIIPLLSSVVTAVPYLFSVFLFIFVWIGGTSASYYAILKTTGRKRFWHALTSLSFICFLLSLLIAGMNTSTIEFLNGYWIGFYLLMTIVSWFLLSNYK